MRLQHVANAGEQTSLGQLLRQIERQSQKTCDTDEREWRPPAQGLTVGRGGRSSLLMQAPVARHALLGVD